MQPIIDTELFNNGASIEKKSAQISKIKTDDIIEQSFSLSSTSFTSACVRITKAAIIYDEQCFDIDLSAIKNSYDSAFPEEMKVDWRYDKASETLHINLSKEILNNINARIRVLKGNTALFDEDAVVSGAFEKDYPVPKENAVLIIDDRDAKRQQVIQLNLSDNAISTLAKIGRAHV